MACLDADEERETTYKIERFLYREAAALDDLQYDEWLSMLDAEFYYSVPIPVIREDPYLPRYDEKGVLFEANRRLMALKMSRLKHEYAWSDRPPGFTRRLVTNVRVESTDSPDRLAVSSHILVSRSTRSTNSTITANRKDEIRVIPDPLKPRFLLLRRDVYIDVAVATHQQLNVIF